MKRTVFIFLVFFGSIGALWSQSDAVVFHEEDVAVFNRYADHMEPFRTQPTETVLEKTALFFLGSPYVAHTLEIGDDERLVVNLRVFDCVTYIETVIALAKTAVSDDFSFDAFAGNLRNVRYRNGTIGNYSTRLHYTSDWVWNNERKGLLENISCRLGGKKERKKIGFMSAHRMTYRQLKSDDGLLAEITAVENEMNARGGFYYVPKSEIDAVAAKIPHLAMIGFTTAIEGLDTTHTGFAFRKDGKLTFIHASGTQKKVVIDPKTLHDYCAAQKSCTGIIVARVR